MSCWPNDSKNGRTPTRPKLRPAAGLLNAGNRECFPRWPSPCSLHSDPPRGPLCRPPDASGVCRGACSRGKEPCKSLATARSAQSVSRLRLTCWRRARASTMKCTVFPPVASVSSVRAFTASRRTKTPIIRSLNQRRVDYLLVGGYALFAHGYHRATTDIDLLVPATLYEQPRTRRGGACLRAAHHSAGLPCLSGTNLSPESRHKRLLDDSRSGDMRDGTAAGTFGRHSSQTDHVCWRGFREPPSNAIVLGCKPTKRRGEAKFCCAFARATKKENHVQAP